MQKKGHAHNRRRSTAGLQGRIWVDGQEETFLGYGRVVLLERIRKHGSITKAAKSMEMSYRHAWELVDSMNRQAAEPLVDSAAGGSGGGGANLTTAGEEAIRLFWTFYEDFQDFLAKEEKKLRFSEKSRSSRKEVRGGNMFKKLKCLLMFALCAVAFTSVSASAATEIICSSTTSTENSGLFAYILPMFEKKTGIKVKVVARGTGAAIEMGKRGDADVAFVHAKEQELKAVEEGSFVNRHDVMYNDFVIIGPPDDPAKIKGMKSAAEALKKISGSAAFVSRGDNSGTNTKELSIWKNLGIEPKGQKWYLEVGQGMEKTQRIANEKRAYTLTDRGTWLGTKDRDKLEMVVVLEGDPILFNQYGIMAVNPEKHKHVKYKEATEFVNWLISKEGQQAIGSFKDKNGNALFIPNAK